MAGIIRRASPDDAGVLCALAERTFVETFGHLYPPQDLADYLASAYPPELQRRQLQSGDYAAWLLEVGGEPVGFAFAGPCGLPHADARPGDGELKRLYVLRGHQGGGWGGKLFAAAEQWLLGAGPRTLWIGVWSENFGAQRFYARHGFDKVGEYDFPVGRTRDREFILRRPAPGA
ncbi:GNAT family N-acetyltransferase [Stenotrophomonas acidaminiphila]|uniref:GNAT family N-acetyltransferase n=1 Tax=Stenotrophomonas acidaminiphila TaxID=128780 RepID=UPI002ABD3E34|nr:GNAT family N-acetyltransferase [Stenotrophomonas acidaminiphila]WPU56891.1 GNAT family N-acetyltransferase [Stenotrophomonas acidaminiphila]